jgi:asparagine synthase (glutamine-hydrolysing)
MCGIAGLISDNPIGRDVLERMTRSIVQRGPDDSGHWLADGGRVGFGHRRLSVIDLTAAGHQPMHSASGRFTITFNGEIYNHHDLRMQLEREGMAPEWRGHSDTEVLLEAISAWGVRAALDRASGMFSLGLWDGQRAELTLARDRFGEKPLYLGWVRNRFAFASTLDPIRTLEGFDNGIRPEALACLLARGYVPAPLSIYDRIFKLPPGSLLTIGRDAASVPLDRLPPFGTSGPVRLDRYFDPAEELLAGAAEPISNQSEAIDALGAALTQAVSRQLVADVPVGTFLSGGIDSSLITAIAQRCSSRPVRSFSIGFSEPGYNEAVYAKRVAQAIGTDHTELYVTDSDARDVIPQLPAIYDEPFADSSQVPTYLVSRLARGEVTVALTGDAGDELFGGYNRHVQFPRLWRLSSAFPAFLRRPALEGASLIPPRVWDGLGAITGRWRSENFGRNAQRAIGLMARNTNMNGLFDQYLDNWAVQGLPVKHPASSRVPLMLDARLSRLPLETRIMHADMVTYLPDDILCKVDRASMAMSLETRVPFLSPEVTALAARIAPQLKFRGGSGKVILKQLLATMVPPGLFERPKAGFAVPVGKWIKGPLRDWAEELLEPAALADSGLLDPQPIRRRWEDHLAGREDATEALWAVLMFQTWLKRGN